MKRSATPEYRREYRRKYREKNCEKVRESALNYYRANKEKLNARRRELWALNRTQRNAKKKEWRAKQDQSRLKALAVAKTRRWRSIEKNHAASIATCRKYKEKHKERLRKWRQENEIAAANDNYVRHLLKLKKSDCVPVELIQAKREHIKLVRKLKTA